jgi:hypothetical protein
MTTSIEELESTYNKLSNISMEARNAHAVALSAYRATRAAAKVGESVTPLLKETLSASRRAFANCRVKHQEASYVYYKLVQARKILDL